MLNLDTHILIYFLSGDLKKHEEGLIRKHDLVISDIVLWELSKLVQLKKLEFDLKDSEFLALLTSVTIIPIRLEIAILSTKLDIHGDPADEIIAATSLAENIPLLTRDRKILRSKIVPLAV